MQVGLKKKRMKVCKTVQKNSTKQLRQTLNFYILHSE